MANLNMRQITFLNDLSNFAKDIEDLYGRAHDLQKRYVEEFDSEKDHCLADCSNLEESRYYDSTDVANAIDYGLAGFINYWVGNAVTTREYGKDLRRIK
jgi:hypothetical protein